MKSFVCIIRKSKFFQSDARFFVKEVCAQETKINFSGGSLRCTLENKWKGEEGISINGNTITLLEGLIYEHKKKYISKNTLEIFSKELNADRANIAHFNGDFRCSAINSSEVFFATNKIKSKDIFYFDNDEYLVFSSHISRIVEVLKKNQVKFTLDNDGAYLLLSYGYMLGNITPISEIKRLEPGCTATLTNEGLKILNYFKFTNRSDIELSENEWIEKLDSVFSKAIRNEFQKDLDHGFKHIVTLSGGMDSRMVLAYAKKLGYDDITTFCFSQSGHLEHKIAEEVAHFFNTDFKFVGLNGGEYLKEIDRPVQFNSGTVNYDGGSHVMYALSQIDLNQFGVLHTGQLGDGLLGTLLSGSNYVAPKRLKRLELREIEENVLPYVQDELKKYATHELFQLYNRGFNLVFNGYRMIEQNISFSSAFMDEDFIELCLTIPPSLRKNRELYIKWINRKCASAAHTRIASNAMRPLEKYLTYPFKVIPLILKYYNLFYFKIDPRRAVSMIPTKKWLHENKSLRNYQDDYFKNNLNLLDDYPKLLELCNSEYDRKYLQRFKVLTLLAVLNNFFNKS
ncbi:asparagine synthetase B family protein [Dokdonia sinensis]|uniref:asparagine synthase (glutamine-hydrolyzing) n=1 Tax=Dokdonia sinensis TaxID=2479847 RepID=A0A3M0GH09_9FLAO|nr:asparagine synthase C-terminal domain-containing protein [Dokdonia sinensis]RMB63837.1 asparagine synthetase B family protein [Dokdonia sinensis]